MDPSLRPLRFSHLHQHHPTHSPRQRLHQPLFERASYPPRRVSSGSVLGRRTFDQFSDSQAHDIERPAVATPPRPEQQQQQQHSQVSQVKRTFQLLVEPFKRLRAFFTRPRNTRDGEPVAYVTDDAHEKRRRCIVPGAWPSTPSRFSPTRHNARPLPPSRRPLPAQFPFTLPAFPRPPSNLATAHVAADSDTEMRDASEVQPSPQVTAGVRHSRVEVTAPRNTFADPRTDTSDFSDYPSSPPIIAGRGHAPMMNGNNSNHPVRTHSGTFTVPDLDFSDSDSEPDPSPAAPAQRLPMGPFLSTARPAARPPAIRSTVRSTARPEAVLPAHRGEGSQHGGRARANTLAATNAPTLTRPVLPIAVDRPSSAHAAPPSHYAPPAPMKKPSTAGPENGKKSFRADFLRFTPKLEPMGQKPTSIAVSGPSLRPRAVRRVFEERHLLDPSPMKASSRRLEKIKPLQPELARPSSKSSASSLEEAVQKPSAVSSLDAAASKSSAAGSYGRAATRTAKLDKAKLAELLPASPVNEDMSFLDDAPPVKHVHFNGQGTMPCSIESVLSLTPPNLHKDGIFPTQTRYFYNEDAIHEKRATWHEWREAKLPATPDDRVLSPDENSKPRSLRQTILGTPKTPDNSAEETPLQDLTQKFSNAFPVSDKRTGKRIDFIAALKRRQEEKAAAAAAAAKRKAEEEAAKARAAEEEAKRQKEARSIVKPLEASWSKKLHEAMATKDPTAQLTPAGLSRKDMGTLMPTGRADGIGWLNDEIVNVYLSAMTSSKLAAAGYDKSDVNALPEYHAFSTHLYTTYQKKGWAGVARWFSRARLAGRRLLTCRQVLIPVNDGSHWTLLSVSGRSRTIEYYDSMGGRGRKHTEFAVDLVRSNLGEAWVEGEWTVRPSASQMQENALDCGVFVCMNALALLTDRTPADAFTAAEMPDARRQVAATLLNGGFSGEFSLE